MGKKMIDPFALLPRISNKTHYIHTLSDSFDSFWNKSKYSSFKDIRE